MHAGSRERAAAPAPGARRGGAPAVRRHLTGLAADRADIHSFLRAHHHRRTEVLCPLGTEHKPYPRPKLPSLICTQPAATGRTSVCAAARGAARGRSPAAPRAPARPPSLERHHAAHVDWFWQAAAGRRAFRICLKPSITFPFGSYVLRQIFTVEFKRPQLIGLCNRNNKYLTHPESKESLHQTRCLPPSQNCKPFSF